MAPNVTSSPTEDLCTPETTLHSSSEIRAGVEKPALKYRREIVWPNVVMHIYLNVAALYGAYLMLTSAKILTGIWGMCKYLYVLYSVCVNVHKCVSEYAKVCVYRRVCTYLLICVVHRAESFLGS